MDEPQDKSGYVYILTSKNCDCIKIGGTDYPPMKRIKQINSTNPYKTHGVWHLQDFRHVSDWRSVEYHLHYKFRSFLNKTIPNQKELFAIPWQQAATELNNIDETLLIRKPKVDRMFMDLDFRNYLVNLFNWSGLLHWLDFQGAWSFVLFPNTNGGRYFTLSIGKHEVAYSTLPKKGGPITHMILLDELILDYTDTGMAEFLDMHNGGFFETPYTSAMERSVCAIFEGDFVVATKFLSFLGVRRALIAYWHEALFRMKDSQTASVYSRFHNYNAVAKLISEIDL